MGRFQLDISREFFLKSTNRGEKLARALKIKRPSDERWAASAGVVRHGEHHGANLGDDRGYPGIVPVSFCVADK